jgi:anti-sigma regulatory factor (Ser/Thr protein kinase)
MIVTLPRQFRAEQLFTQVEQHFGQFEQLPEEISFDFSRMQFLRPSGVVFLSNLSRYLSHRGCCVRYSNLDVNRSAIQFLDDAKFFEQHLGEPLAATSGIRPTTQPLQAIHPQESHAWLEFTLLPWLSAHCGVPVRHMAELKTCLSEVFNNIADHTDSGLGSVFAQWYPREENLEICIADIGQGIPNTVARIVQGLSDSEAIALAFEDGFSSQSLPTNRGVGLFYLQQNVVQNFSGTLRCLSAGGGVTIDKVGNLVRKVPYKVQGFCPGTMIEMRFRTDLLYQADEEGDFEW